MRDQVLLRTAQIMHAVRHDEFDRIDGIPVEFGVDGSYPDNRIVLASPFELFSYEAAGDGTYVRNDGFFFATGGIGLGLTAASMIGRAAGNSARRQAAQDAATPRWRVIDQGYVYINQYGFFLRTPTDLLRWMWGSIETARMIDRRQFAMLGNSSSGRVNYVVSSDAAELLFAFWALARQPQHPQLAQRVWLLPEWLDQYRKVMGPEAFDFWNDPT